MRFAHTYGVRQMLYVYGDICHMFAADSMLLESFAARRTWIQSKDFRPIFAKLSSCVPIELPKPPQKDCW